MEIKQDTLFTFNFVALGQGFSFGLPAATRDAAMKDLQTKLHMILAELETEMNRGKLKAS